MKKIIRLALVCLAAALLLVFLPLVVALPPPLAIAGLGVLAIATIPVVTAEAKRTAGKIHYCDYCDGNLHRHDGQDDIPRMNNPRKMAIAVWPQRASHRYNHFASRRMRGLHLAPRGPAIFEAGVGLGINST